MWYPPIFISLPVLQVATVLNITSDSDCITVYRTNNTNIFTNRTGQKTWNLFLLGLFSTLWPWEPIKAIDAYGNCLSRTQKRWASNNKGAYCSFCPTIGRSTFLFKPRGLASLELWLPQAFANRFLLLMRRVYLYIVGLCEEFGVPKLQANESRKDSSSGMMLTAFFFFSLTPLRKAYQGPLLSSKEKRTNNKVLSPASFPKW